MESSRFAVRLARTILMGNNARFITDARSMFPGKTYEEVKIGESFSSSLTITETHLVLAAGRSVTLSSLNYDNIEFEVQAPANKVVNLGELLSDGGSIGVFAGSIENRGTVSANAIRVNDAGEIELVAQGDNVQQDGVVTATSKTGQGILA